MATDKKNDKSKSKDDALEKTPEPGALVAYDYGDDEGVGYEHQTAADTSIPFIILLQGLSPQVKNRIHPMALDGNMMNNVTEQFYDRDQGFLFVPATTRHLFAKWVPRDRGGGFRGHLEPDNPIVLQAIKETGAAAVKIDNHIHVPKVKKIERDKDGNMVRPVYEDDK